MMENCFFEKIFWFVIKKTKEKPKTIILFLATFLVLNIIFLLLHSGFIKFVTITKGVTKALGVMMICYLDTFIMLMSIFFGCLSYFVKRRY